ncbi:uncharacterized protein METZ01_LOCUS250055 [marine metagenome]|uniref:Uncharacterized protein n=1 Tax=marine metagenome TaxID=408172 RepID=A0A382IEX6_9ZZZZ
MGRVYFELFGYSVTGWGVLQIFIFIILFIIGVSN